MTPHLARRVSFILVFIAGLVSVSLMAQPAAAAPVRQDTSPTVTNTQPSVSSGNRPQILIESYSVSKDTIKPGDDFDLYITLKNAGSSRAENISISFTPGDLIPRNNGGILYVSGIDPGGKFDHRQPLTASSALTGGGVSSLIATVTYNDANGSYSGTFNLAFHINWPVYAPAGPTKTPTPVTVYRPQLAITGYNTDIDPLQPGRPFKLSLQVRNLGNADAKSVTMIMGGGSGSSGSASGTPEPGGVSGASGEFTNFAPLKSSNIKALGDVPTNQEISVDQSLITNVSTNPGAYSVKFSFTYVDEHGTRFTDDQVITLLVYQLPLVEVNFYRDAGPFFAGQPGALPIQIVNNSRKQVVLGNMKASIPAEAGQVTNASTLVGAMDPGGYFTLDANLIPNNPGPLDVDITVSYTDDFNQPQSIHQKLQVTVQEMQMEPLPGDSGIPGGKPGTSVNPGGMPTVPEQPETFTQKLIRALKGLIGLDSGRATPATSPVGPGEIPSQNGAPGPSKPIIVGPAKG